MTARAELPEKQWQAVLLDGLARTGWTVMHVRRAKVSTAGGPRWLTPTSQPGWPDLFAVRAGHLLGIEVKGPRTTVDPEQIAWLALLAETPNGHGWILRPADDWQAIAAWLKRPAEAPALWGVDPSRLPDPPAVFLAQAASRRRAGRSSRGSNGERGGTTPSLDDPPTGQLPML